MSKVDAQRAMREAKYARTVAGGARRREAAGVETPPVTPDARTSTPKPARGADVVSATAAPEGDRCGHKSMNGRACTREAGHSEKSHRYG